MSSNQESSRPYLPDIGVYIDLLEEYLGGHMLVDEFAKSFCGQRSDDIDRMNAGKPTDLRRQENELWAQFNAGRITLEELNDLSPNFWPFDDDSPATVVSDAINAVNGDLNELSSEPPYQLSEEQLRVLLAKHLGVLKETRDAYERLVREH